MFNHFTLTQIFNQKTAADKKHDYEYASLFKQAFDSGLLHAFINRFSNNSWLAIIVD
jgi:hypothetical protein